MKKIKEKTISKNKVKKVVLNIVILAILIVVIALTVRTQGTVTNNYQSNVYATFFSLLPPIVAITLALITKEVYSSLFIGVTVGAFLFSSGNAELAFNTMLYNESGGLVTNLTNISHAGILVFVTILGTLVVLMNKSGGASEFGKWTLKHIKSRVGAQLATILMGIMIFVDDGFNCMTVGSVMKPITDSHKISRAKLAYILDATAAPICVIAPISCWAAAVTYAVPDSMNINGFQMFIKAIPYNFYALGTLVMLTLTTVLKLDFGPMTLHESNAQKGDLFTTGDVPYNETVSSEKEKVSKISNLIIPVVTLIVLCILGMAYTGGAFAGENIIDAFANADSAKGLVMGSLLSVIITFWLYMNRGIITFNEFMESFAAGFRSMCAPMIILILSWNLSGMTSLLGATDFIHSLMEKTSESLNIFIPCIVFIVSVFLAFSTGTSWGTFTILIPIVCAIFPPESEMLTISISACLAGAVCGDHCSPISDTTIMASAGAQCNHINHVTTQLPYALTVAAVSAVGYLICGIIGYLFDSKLALISMPITLVLMVIILLIIKKRATNNKL